ncbi:hypothetical protein D9756_009654 [Leucocoprinus leucothites]|uniref:Protein kinase domain-containing protein n=1 Tax=Leucocoprinus leucothites TaxID=201217 RepID=A0A8H5CVZ2_9AGAR|nr:hypothetical protein D9756_009654 [Leucoagaricus leucothites]
MAIPSLQILQGIQLIDTQYFACGGFADIFMGQWLQQSGETLRVAVKLVRKRNTNDLERNRKRFSREAHLWALLRHHNLVPLHGLHCEQGIPGLVMPYYANGDLVNYLQCHPQADKLSLIRGIAAGLEYMHGFKPNPVIHGDIKASNIMVTDAGEACLADFGLAKILCTPGYTTPNVCGSSRWMSPEILRGDELPTTSSDIWSLAMTILEASCLTSSP